MTALELKDRNALFYKITGLAMQVHAEYHPGLLESAYEAALVFLLKRNGISIEEQVNLPMYWKEEKLPKHYIMDLVVNGDTIIELKAVKYVSNEHRKQLWNYMHLTHMPFGLLLNFGNESLFSEWYHRRNDGTIDKLTWHKNQMNNFDEF